MGTRFGGDSGQSPSVAIIDAVAAAEGVAPTMLDPLYDEIDPELIDQLFRDGDTVATPSKLLRVSVDGWNVFVRDDGAIRVCDPTRETEPAPAFDKSIND